MNIFLRIGQSIERRREYVAAIDALNDALKQYSCEFDEALRYNAHQYANCILEKYRDPFGMERRYWYAKWDDDFKSAYDSRDYKPEIIPSRLRFKVDGRRFEIIIGNPVTQCDMRDGKYTHYSAVTSVCNPKDTYNWKRGAIVALENFADQHHFDRDLRKQCFESMFKKYPELRNAADK